MTATGELRGAGEVLMRDDPRFAQANAWPGPLVSPDLLVRPPGATSGVFPPGVSA